MTTARTNKATKAFVKHQEDGANGKYKVAGESMSVDQKLEILKARGETELIDIFKEWKPRVSARRVKGAPLDQRVSITVSTSDRVSLDAEIKRIKSEGKPTTLGALIRNRAMGTVDLVGWASIATEALNQINEIAKDESTLKARKKSLNLLIEDEDDQEQISVYDRELVEITRKLDLITSRGEKRSNRLQGRMSMNESETVKWRAQRLCISTSDYLRMMIFGLEPNSVSDAHMSLDAKRRFYISIIEVSQNGWGSPPTIFQCSQCETYLEELNRLRDLERLRELER